MVTKGTWNLVLIHYIKMYLEFNTCSLHQNVLGVLVHYIKTYLEYLSLHQVNKITTTSKGTWNTCSLHNMYIKIRGISK